MEGYFEETENTVKIDNLYSNNEKMILERKSAYTMKAAAFDREIEYVEIPIGTVSTCDKN